MQEKAEQGIWPTKTPLGYRNITSPEGKKIIVTDPVVAPIITKLFEWYATGQYSVREVTLKARELGLVYRKSGTTVPASTVNAILRNRTVIVDVAFLLDLADHRTTAGMAGDQP